jgi:hypothetical protein
LAKLHIRPELIKSVQWLVGWLALIGNHFILVPSGNVRLRDFLGGEPHTPLEVAVREALIGIGCLPRCLREIAESTPVTSAS